MASPPHFLLIPFMAQGHMIPMVDFGRVLARRGIMVTIVTTPHNASRFETIVQRDRISGLAISFVKLGFPWKEAGLPEPVENQDQLTPSMSGMKFLAGASFLQEPVEKLFETLQPRPHCIISDGCLPFTMNVANKFRSAQSEEECFVVPGIPDRIELNKVRAPPQIPDSFKDFHTLLATAEGSSYGMISNTFEEMEPQYVEGLKKARGKVWCVGPVSLCNTENSEKAERGNKAVIDQHFCLNWLDSQQQGSVLYVCFGSLCNLISTQLIELALGLESSKSPFIWAIRAGKNSDELKNWVSENDFEGRIKGRGLLIWGWAPQVLILSHPSVGGFLTHCGANGIQEGVCAGVPLITWPLFFDQFVNEQLVIQVLKIGVSAGAKFPLNEGEEDKYGIQVTKEVVRAAIDELMDEGEKSRERRRRVKELADKARRAVAEGGSSHLDVSLLIKDMEKQMEMI